MKSKFKINGYVGLILAILLLGLASPFMSSVSADPTFTAKIWTDKADYHPGENVTIYGSGFSPFSHVMLEVTKVKDSTVTQLDVTSNSMGDFETIYQIDPQGAPYYTITANDGKNKATTAFTDSSQTLTITDETSGGYISTHVLDVDHLTVHAGDMLHLSASVTGISPMGMPFVGSYIVFETPDHTADYIPGDTGSLTYSDVLFTVPAVSGPWDINYWAFEADSDSFIVCSVIVNVVSAGTPIASQLVFSGPSTLVVGTDGHFTIQQKTATDNAVTATSTVTITLPAPSLGGWYSDEACTNPITSIQISAGSSTTATFYYKSSSTGSVTLNANAPGFPIGSQSLTVNAASIIGLNPTSGYVGEILTLTGSAFTHIGIIAQDQVEITFDGSHASTITVGSDGSVWAQFPVPEKAAGTYTIHAVRTVAPFDSADATFTVDPVISFRTSGMTGDASAAVLNIGGVDYTYTQLQTLSFNFWMAGSTHSVIAASPVSVGDGKQYVFVSWTNGNGLTTASGTFTTPTADTTVTVTYKTQYQASFSASGLDANSAGHSVLTVGATDYAYNAVASASGWYDAGTTFSWASIVSGGAGTQFILHSNDNGLTSPINAAGADTVVYFKQFQVTPYFTVSHGASPTVTNVVRYFYNGAPQTATPTLGSVGGSACWADEGSAVSYQSPITSGFERWIVAAGDTTPGRNTAITSVSGVQDVTVLYYNQWNVAFAYDTSDSSVIKGISGAAGGIYRFTQFGATAYITTDASGTLSATSAFADENGAIQYHSALDNSNYPATIPSSERYMVASGDTDWNTAIAHLTSAGSLGYTYYHQFQDTLSYLIIGGGSPTAPTSTTSLFGVAYTPTLTTVATTYWADKNAAWSITNPLGGSSGTECWQSNQVLSGVVTAAGGVSVLTYYHQFDVAFQYSVNGDVGTSTAPTAYYTKFGAQSSMTASLTVFPEDWVDVDSTVSYTNPLGGAVDSTGERWQTGGTIVSGKTVINADISSSQIIRPAYNHQFLLTVTGGNNVGYSNSGSAGHWYSQADSTTVSSDWVYNADANSRTVVTNWQLDSANQNPAQQYTGTLTTTTITMDAAHTVNFVSSTQYHVTYLASGNANSITAPTDEWVTSGQTATGTFPVSVTVASVKDTYLSNNATAITSATTITGLYQTSYWITVTSSHGNPTLTSQWVNKDASFSVSVTSPEIVTSGSDRWVVSEPTTQTISNVQAAQTLTFSWTEQYYLTVSSPNGSPTGQGWYNAGSTANFGVTTPDGTVGTRYLLTGWLSSDTNGYTGTDAVHSITMNGAATETATWQTQYQVTFAVNPSGSGTTSPSGTGVWSNAGSLSIAATQNVGYTFSSWTSTGSVSFTNVNAASTTATLAGPGTITAVFSSNQAANFVFSTVGAQTAGSSFTLTVTAKDALGNTVQGYLGTVHFTSTDSQAALPSDYTFQTSDSGIHTFTVTLKTAGIQTVTATDKATDSLTKTTAGITVAHAYAVAYLNINPASSTITAGSSKTYTITAHDSYGNTWDVSSSTTWSISSDAEGSWNGNVYTSAVAGDFTVTATYASAAYTTSLTVNPGALDHFSVSAPSQATAGAVFWLTIFPRDVFGNVLKTFSGSVSLNASQGAITPTSAAFSSPGWNNTVALSSIGSITVGVSDAEGHSGISSAIVVSAPAATPIPTPTSTPSPTPSSSPTPSPTPQTSNSTITATTNTGTTVEVALSGNITSLQISGAQITSNQTATTTTLSFNVTGETGTAGLCNMTFSKSDIPYGTTPIVYVDGQQVENQGYSQDNLNFYVWFTTHFSSHQVQVQFTGARTNTHSNPQNTTTIIIAAATTVLVLLVAIVILAKKNSNKGKQSKYSPKNHPLYMP